MDLFKRLLDWLFPEVEEIFMGCSEPGCLYQQVIAVPRVRLSEKAYCEQIQRVLTEGIELHQHLDHGYAW